MAINVVCNSCGAALQAPDKVQGKSLPCPKCGAQVLVAETHAAEDADDDLKLELIEEDASNEELADDELSDGEPNLDHLLTGFRATELAPTGTLPGYQRAGFQPRDIANQHVHASGANNSGAAHPRAIAPRDSQLSDGSKRLLIAGGGLLCALIGCCVLLFLVAMFRDSTRGAPSIEFNGNFEPNRRATNIRSVNNVLYLPRRVWVKSDGRNIEAMLKSLPDANNDVRLLTADNQVVTLNRSQLDAVDNQYIDRVALRPGPDAVSTLGARMLGMGCVGFGALLGLGVVFFLPGGLMIWHGRRIAQTKPLEGNRNAGVPGFFHHVGWWLVATGGLILLLLAFAALSGLLNVALL